MVFTFVFFYYTRALGEDISREALSVFRKLTSQLMAEEVRTLGEFTRHPDVSAALGPSMAAMADVDPVHFEVLGEALGRVRRANVPRIESALRELNITLAGFLTDPSLFVRFLKDQVKR